MKAGVISALRHIAPLVLALLTYERVVAWGVVASIGLGLVNFVRIGRQAGAIKGLQEAQGQRISELPPPPGA